MLVDHLVTVHKAKTIEYISSEIDDAEFRKELEDYFLNAVKKAGLSVTEHSIHYGTTNVGNEIQIVEDMLKQEGGLPQAIICGNTESVSGFIFADRPETLYFVNTSQSTRICFANHRFASARATAYFIPERGNVFTLSG